MLMWATAIFSALSGTPLALTVLVIPAIVILPL